MISLMIDTDSPRSGISSLKEDHSQRYQTSKRSSDTGWRREVVRLWCFRGAGPVARADVHWHESLHGGTISYRASYSVV